MALAHYYALRLWQEYLEAKQQWEHAHAEYTSAPFPIQPETRHALELTRANMDALLIQLRATPEHKEAFGW